MSKNQPKVSDEQIRQFMANDLASAISFLNMIRNDKEIMDHIGDVVIARIRTDEENKANQPELALNGKD